MRAVFAEHDHLAAARINEMLSAGPTFRVLTRRSDYVNLYSNVPYKVLQKQEAGRLNGIALNNIVASVQFQKAEATL